MKWRTPDGEKHAQQVKVRASVVEPQHFSGVVYFKYSRRGDAERWTVVSVTYAEQDRLAGEGKSTVPADPPEPATAPATLPSSRTAINPAARPSALVPIAPKPLIHAEQPSYDVKAAIIEALKYLHLASMRPELLPTGDYCESDDPATARFIRACSRIAAAAHDLAGAVSAKLGAKALPELNLDFPDKAKILKDGWAELKDSGDTLADELEHATVDVHGDRATIRFKGEAMEARRVDGHWKIAVPSIAQIAAGAGLGGDRNADANKMARDCDLEAGIDERLAADVRAGKFATAQDVARARDQRRQAAGKMLEEQSKNPRASGGL